MPQAQSLFIFDNTTAFDFKCLATLIENIKSSIDFDDAFLTEINLETFY